MIKSLILVGTGGFIGSVLRFSIGYLIKDKVDTLFVPTLIINLLGCFLIGLLYEISEKYDFLSSDIRLLLIVGLCGGFTTFSTFTFETFSLLKSGCFTEVFTYITASLTGGLLLLYLGIYLVKLL
ncbi:MAG: fluoride efflux transporter CrcB [Bacteroidia bacterium]|nr:fluoride efflux transporter CrcB [Bacteroidia bacterium]